MTRAERDAAVLELAAMFGEPATSTRELRGAVGRKSAQRAGLEDLWYATGGLVESDWFLHMGRAALAIIREAGHTGRGYPLADVLVNELLRRRP